jgi:LuxR family transcriptional regulator, quorum-sensing system regulator SdiA
MGTPDIDDFSQRLSATRNFDAALDVLAEAVRTLGFDAVDYAALPAARVLDGAWAGQRIFERDFPSGWQRGWRVHGRFDPILPTSFREGLPVDWQAVRRRSLTRPEREAIAVLDSMGFPGGLTVPIHLPGNRFAFVSGASCRSGEAWDKLYTLARLPMMVLAHTFHHVVAAREPSQWAADVRLTRREIQCLQFAAHGNAAPATARQMNRSVDTVRRHLKSAMAKLGARTIAQSVAIGVACGLIEGDRLTRPAPD